MKPITKTKPPRQKPPYIWVGSNLLIDHKFTICLNRESIDVKLRNVSLVVSNLAADR